MMAPYPRVYGAPEGRLRMVTLEDLKARRLAYEAEFNRVKGIRGIAGLVRASRIDRELRRARADEIEAFYATIERWGA